MVNKPLKIKRVSYYEVIIDDVVDPVRYKTIAQINKRYGISNSKISYVASKHKLSKINIKPAVIDGKPKIKDK